MNQAVDMLYEQHFEFSCEVQEKYPGQELVSTGHNEKTNNWWALLFCPSNHKFTYIVQAVAFTSIKDVPDALYATFRFHVERHLDSMNFRSFEDVKVGQFFYAVDDEESRLMEKTSKCSAKFHHPEHGEYRVFHPKAAIRRHLG